MSMYEEYFQLTRENISKYGQETIVLLQCGDFYEIYGTIDPETGDIIDSQMAVVTEHCSLAMSKKGHLYQGRELMMAGCNLIAIEKYLQQMVEFGHTVCIYVQTDDYCKKTKKKIRKLDSVHSPSTYIAFDTSDKTQQTSNHVMCIWLESAFSARHINKMVYGVAVLNSYNGQTSMYETITDAKIHATTFDELDKIVSIYRPKECILITNKDIDTEEDQDLRHAVSQFSGLSQHLPNTKIHAFNTKDVVCKKCSKQTYIQQILNAKFGDECFQQCREFVQYTIATQAFCFLLHFIEERNASLIKHIYMPIFHNVSQRMHLANHTLRQLNILSDDSEDGKKMGNLNSVHSFLNKCCTGIGKRRFQYLITHPCFDEEWLTTEYDMMDRVLISTDSRDLIMSQRKILSRVCDMEKVSKQISFQKIFPSTVHNWYRSLLKTEQLFNCFAEMPKVAEYLCTPEFSRSFHLGKTRIQQFHKNILNIIQYLETHLHLERCASTSSLVSFEENIIPAGINVELDEMITDYETTCVQLDVIQAFFEKLMPQGRTECIKRNKTEKNGISLQLTKPRCDVLKKQIASTYTVDEKIVLSNGVEFPLSDIRYVAAKSNTMEIVFPLLNNICTKITTFKNTLNQKIGAEYLRIIGEIDEEYSETMDDCSQFIAKLDVLICKCFMASQYRYIRPVIDEDAPKSYFNVKNLRHVLIEQLVKQELYVTNDVCLGKRSDSDPCTPDGILLYGTNAVGKTSMIRACGVAIIMAQAGMYVPCTEFVYKPYKSIFSRILSNDNLFKGLSTFAVEMSELRVILNNADENSFVLGDELCSGTETESAISIVMAALEELHRKNCTLLFATHFHELVDYAELKSLSRMQLKHLAVFYDREADCLIYDRKIRDGPGKRTYGLEVCKSLYLPDDFIERAFTIRKTHFEENKGTLEYKVSHFNSKKIKGKCEMCGKYSKTNEIHHLQEQHLADEAGYIDGIFHKDHIGNLITVCEECHDRFHGKGDHASIVYEEDAMSRLTGDVDEDSPNETNTVHTKRVIRRKKTNKGYKLIEQFV